MVAGSAATIEYGNLSLSMGRGSGWSQACSAATIEYGNLSLSTDRGSGAWEEVTGRIASWCNRGDDKTMVCASKQELASLDKKNELLMS